MDESQMGQVGRAGGTVGVTQAGMERWEQAQALLSALLERLRHPQARVITRTGFWTLRALAWQQRARQATRMLRVTAQRAQWASELAARVAYFALPLPAAASHERGTVDQIASERRLARKRTAELAARVRIIVNPASGTVQRLGGIEELEEVVRWLDAHDVPAELCETERPGHAIQLAREAVKAGADMVVAAGGDGTVNDVIQALAGTTTALGVLPMGTVNVWARETGIPLNTAAAREVLLHGVRRRVDLGRANSRYFLLMAGIGFDAEVARRVEHSWLKRWGLKFVDYLATAGRMGMTHPATRISLRVDGKRRNVNALMALIGNTRLYAGALSITNQAVADDGMLDVVVVSGGGTLHRLAVFTRALLRRPSLGPHVRYMRCRTIRMESHSALPVQVDGEVIGTLPMTFSVAPHALTAVTPEDAPSELFRNPPLR